MADSAPQPTSGDVAPRPTAGALALVCLQVSLLCLLYAGWLGLGRVWRLPFPANLLAMLSLLGLLLARVVPLSSVERGAAFLLRYIGLLFVPVCVGAVHQLPLLRTRGWAFAALIIAGTLMGQAMAGLLAQALGKKPVDSPAPEGLP